MNRLSTARFAFSALRNNPLSHSFTASTHRWTAKLPLKLPIHTNLLNNCVSACASNCKFPSNNSFVGFHTTCAHFSKDSGDPEQMIQKDEHLKELIKEINKDFAGVLAEDGDSSGDSSSDSDSNSSSSSSDSESETESDNLKHKSKDISTDNRSQKPKIDVDQELLRYDYEEFVEKEDYDEMEEADEEEIHSISLERGSSGVFDVAEVVQLLDEDNAMDLCVIQIPAEVKYVDHMVIATGRSLRHLQAMAGYIKKLYKLKRRKGDPPTCMIEGKQTEWLALDLGNIAVHLFTASVREQYDLETLWTVGPEFDPQSQTYAGDEELPFFWDETDFQVFEPQRSSEETSRSLSRSMQESSDNWHRKT